MQILLASNQGWEIAHLLIAHLLKLLRSNKQLWAIRSDRWGQMNNCKQFSQISHDKWANEWIAHFFEQITHLLFYSPKTSNLLKKNLTKIKFFGVFLYFFVSFKKTSNSLIPSFLMSNVSESLRLLTKNEQCEWIASGCLPQMFNYEGFAQVAHQK